MIAVISYGAGNVFSVAKALDALGAQVELVSNAEDLRRASHIVLPGVGAFREAMESLKSLDLTGALEEEVLGNGKAFLGICLGMQLLADEGDEGGTFPGLGWVRGHTRFLGGLIDSTLRLPHVGWNDVQLDLTCPLFQGLNEQEDFYFVHSYHLEPEDGGVVAATCDYGGRFVAALWRENIFATQFHPEKSQAIGLRVLENFLDWGGHRC